MQLKQFYALPLLFSQLTQAFVTGKASEVINVDGIEAAKDSTALTYRTASATVENEIGETIYGVALIHKYTENNYDQAAWAAWAKVENGTKANPSLAVDYRTRFGAIGQNWWLATWISDDGKTLYSTEPSNGQCFLDLLEELSPSATSTVTKAIYAFATKSSNNAAAVAVRAVGQLIKPLLRLGETCGFTRHILRADDDSAEVKITIRADGKATISSPSGVSEMAWYSTKLGN